MSPSLRVHRGKRIPVIGLQDYDDGNHHSTASETPHSKSVCIPRQFFSFCLYISTMCTMTFFVRGTIALATKRFEIPFLRVFISCYTMAQKHVPFFHSVEHQEGSILTVYCVFREEGSHLYRDLGVLDCQNYYHRHGNNPNL
jgi:hypothetical protein